MDEGEDDDEIDNKNEKNLEFVKKNTFKLNAE